MPWLPELFSAPVLARLQEKWELERLDMVPYYAGLMSGEHEALIRSFAGEPVLHEPRRGRIIGVPAFETYVTELGSWLADLNMSFDPIEHVFAEPRGFEEVVIHLDREAGRVDVPVAIVADRRSDGRLEELRIYHSIWALTGRHLHRPPILPPDPDLRPEGVVADYQRALAAGDLDAIMATFEPDGYAREPTGREFVHRGPAALRSFYERYFSNGGGIELEHCALVQDARGSALEYNLVRWGRTELPPEAGVAVYVEGEGGRLAAARIYDDADPPVS
jgi:SnoaL-like domain